MLFPSGSPHLSYPSLAAVRTNTPRVNNNIIHNNRNWGKTQNAKATDYSIYRREHCCWHAVPQMRSKHIPIPSSSSDSLSLPLIAVRPLDLFLFPFLYLYLADDLLPPIFLSTDWFRCFSQCVAVAVAGCRRRLLPLLWLFLMLSTLHPVDYLYFSFFFPFRHSWSLFTSTYFPFPPQPDAPSPFPLHFHFQSQSRFTRSE